MKKIVILKPCGCCYGVRQAIKKINSICKKHQKQKIYLIGWLVHNTQIMQKIRNKHVIVLNDNNHSRISSLKEIKDHNAVIVFSAHGTPIDALKYACQRFTNVYDLTCQYVNNNLAIAQKLLKKKYKILYYGKKKHPETKAIKSLSKNIHVIESTNDISKINKQAKYAFINQTTAPTYLVKKIIKLIHQKNYKTKIINTTCLSTRQRYSNIENLTNIDFLLVVGDKASNNANQLLNLAKIKKINCKLIQTKNQINKKMFKRINTLAITSATSVSTTDFLKIIDKIKQKMI
ncbi:MAG: hypothetical protein LBF00_00510 [Mycoplasmataceae bacterium]|jgi:4-hydroxy-3-methylbut-2-enyl diphosphate reductase|nr:hypothetical protein [Mycoplasmataceae bacterium]